ncbi:MAG: hypothetical protein R6W77_15735 [Trueperaceae bacterium]
MKGVRIVQVILVVVAVAYLLLFHSANPDQVELPLLPILPPVPVSFVVVLALLVGWLVGWIPARLLAWRRGRDLKRVEKRLADLGGVGVPGYVPSNDDWREPAVPVIPDRGAAFPADDDTEAA